jgi:hypothetical protein
VGATSSEVGGTPRRAWVAAAASLAIAAGARAELPGIGYQEVTPETFATFTSTVKMIAPPDPEQPQAWFSAGAEYTGGVASATPDSLNLVEPVPEGAYGGLRLRITGTSPAAGQIRTIAADHSSTQLDVTDPFAITPEPGDGVEVFTGELPPGHWDATCSQADPCLDIRRAADLLRGSVWLWFDAGDVWDDDAEWCDAAHRPPGPWQQGGCDGAQNRLIVSSSPLENQIVWAVSSTDLTGATRATLDCDKRGHYQPQGGGVFENQAGSNNPPNDGPSGWLLVQGIETRCWNRPALGSGTGPSEWGEGIGVYRQEFSGKILALNNRHGDLWDGAQLVSMNGGSFTQGDRYVGGIVLVDVEAHTADYGVMAGLCVATNDPYRSCNGLNFNGIDRGTGGSLQPQLIEAHGGGDVLWVGGAGTIRNKDRTSGLIQWRPFIEAWGFNDFATNSGVGGSQSITLVNLKIEGGGPWASREPVLFFYPSPNRRGTRFETVVVNSSFRGLSAWSAVAHFMPTTEADSATDTSLEMNWMNVSASGFGGVFRKDSSSDTTPEIDGGARWTGRCLLFDGAHPYPPGNRMLDLQSSTESLETRCARNFVDVQGWMDGDDVADQFQLCGTGSSSYASDAMSGTLFEPGNAGQTQGWQIFSQGNSGDWGGRGVDLDVAATPPTSPEIWNAVHGTCSDEAVYPLGQTLPIGFLSTASNPISMIRVAGTRDLGYNDLALPEPAAGVTRLAAVLLLAWLRRRRHRRVARTSGY